MFCSKKKELQTLDFNCLRVFITLLIYSNTYLDTKVSNIEYPLYSLSQIKILLIKYCLIKNYVIF